MDRNPVKERGCGSPTPVSRPRAVWRARHATTHWVGGRLGSIGLRLRASYSGGYPNGNSRTVGFAAPVHVASPTIAKGYGMRATGRKERAAALRRGRGAPLSGAADFSPQLLPQRPG